MGYDIRLKVRLVNNFKTGNISLSQIALREGIPKQTVSRWIKSYKMLGYEGLENGKSGAKDIPINPGFEKLVLNMWEKEIRSPYKMRKDLRKDLKRNGYNISERQIKKIYKKHKLQKYS